jgi:Zn-dependent peptidase ImmA (M78 family)
VINARDSRERQRFTVAHELAHFLLHKENARKRKAHRTEGHVYDPFVYLEPSDRREEVEANRFAAALLMPPNLFKPAFERLDRDPRTIARLFGVSSNAVEIHAANLEL